MTIFRSIKSRKTPHLTADEARYATKQSIRKHCGGTRDNVYTAILEAVKKGHTSVTTWVYYASLDEEYINHLIAELREDGYEVEYVNNEVTSELRISWE